MKYFRILVKAFKDVFADKTRRRISQQEVSICCDDLAKIIQQSYEPNLIIAIDMGGSVPGELIAQRLGMIPVVHLLVRRNINITRRYSNDPIPLRWIMSFYHHVLFQTVKPSIPADIDLDVSGKKVLIVDDTIHTGATADIVIGHLKKANVLEIKVASLAYVSERRPDYSILPFGNYSFPWSKDYCNPEV